MAAARPWTVQTDGVTVTVRLTPKGGHDAIDGVETLANAQAVLKVRVRAIPSDGAANAALEGVLAKALAVPRSRVAIVGGATARIKRVKIAGDPRALEDALEKIVCTR